MRKKLIAVAVLTALVVGAAGFASAGSWARERPAKTGAVCDPGARLDAIAALNLTDEQLASIRGFMTASFERTSTLQRTLAEKMHELRLMYWQKEPDRAGIEAKQAEVAQLREQMREGPKVHEQILEILSDEQKEAFEQLRGLCFGGGRRMPRMMRMMKGTAAPK